VFASFFERYVPDLDQFMRSVVASPPGQPSDFDHILRYALGWVDQSGEVYNQPTGKRIRPILLLLATEAAQGDWRAALPAAGAVELLHNFSLIHDDIQDNSPTRHNRPTVWKIWGQANAINAGDALFALAHVALERLSQSGVDAETLVKIWRIFNATTLELTRGQHLDMRFEHQRIVSVDEYVSMIAGKSAALVAACSQIGSLIACRDEALATHYAEFGLNLGLAFQIHDDILGIWGDPEVTGKSAATDIISRKKSLPVLYGLERSQPFAALYEQSSLSEENIAEAVALLDSVGAQEYTHRMEKHYYDLALRAMENANPQGEAAARLAKLVDVLFERQR
jgi:geranylgeranyl diphosphate synthase type I